MKDTTLALCIPTYKRPEAIREFLDAEAKILKNHLVDLVIVDSSPDGKTSDLVEDFIKSGFGNISYCRVDENISSNEKFFWIYQNYSDKYDYIWITHDHTLYNEESIEYILNVLDNHADFIFLKAQCPEFKNYETKDLCDFFYDSAWLLGKMGASIVKTSSFLNGVDWEKVKEKYLTPQKINFSHVGFYFERAAQMNDFTAVTIEIPTDYFLDLYRNRKLSWENEAVRICTQCWGSVISELPDKYTNKMETIQSIDPYFLTAYKLIEYRKCGCYSWLDFLKYHKWIKLVFPHLYKDAGIIALLPMKYLISKYSKGYSEKIADCRRQGKKICVYGAGKHAHESIDFFTGVGIEIDAVLVTDKRGNVDKLCDILVYDAKEYIENNDVFVVVAVAGVGRDGITHYLEELKKNVNIQLSYCYF